MGAMELHRILRTLEEKKKQTKKIQIEIRTTKTDFHWQCFVMQVLLLKIASCYALLDVDNFTQLYSKTTCCYLTQIYTRKVLAFNNKIEYIQCFNVQTQTPYHNHNYKYCHLQYTYNASSGSELLTTKRPILKTVLVPYCVLDIGTHIDSNIEIEKYLISSISISSNSIKYRRTTQ